MIKQFYLFALIFSLGTCHIHAQEAPKSVPKINQNQLPKEPISATFNVLNKNSNAGFSGSSSCLCTFYFDHRLKDCLLQLSDKEFNEELKRYNQNRIKHVWNMLDTDQKTHFLTTADDTVYQRFTLIVPKLPKTKPEFLVWLEKTKNEQQGPSLVTCVQAAFVIGVDIASAIFLLKR